MSSLDAGTKGIPQIFTELSTQRPGTQKHPRRTCPAFLSCSLTVETALSLPLFLMTAVLLLWPLRVMDGERRLMTAMEEAADAAAAEPEAALLSEAALLLLPDIELFQPALPVVSIGEGERQMVRLSVSPGIRWPVTLFDGLLTVRHTVTVEKRTWTGRAGGAGRGYAASPEEETEYVYLGKNSAESKVYHLTAQCSYLDNVMKAVPAESAAELRNDFGEKYHPCPSCRPGNSGTVYIFSGGNAWHAGTDCRAIGAYVTKITKKEALERGYHPCHRCSRGN